MKFRVIGLALAVVVGAIPVQVPPSDAASPWGLWNDPQGNLVAPEPGATPATTVQEPAAPKVQESKPEKKWELWNDPEPKSASTPPATVAQSSALATVARTPEPATAQPSAPATAAETPAPPVPAPEATVKTPPLPVTVQPTPADAAAATQVVAGKKETATATGQPDGLQNSEPLPAVSTPGTAGTVAAEGAAPAGKGTEAPLPTATEVVTGDGYLIGSGDLLDISVWKDEALTKTVVVLPDGTISFPLAGDVRAAGKSVAAFRADMEQRLRQYVTDLVLSVEVKQTNSMQIYVIGRVNAPGRQVLNGNVTVLQALSLAGGLNPFARKDRISVMRTEGGETKSYPFHYSEVVEGENLAQNILLKRGDVVVVP